MKKKKPSFYRGLVALALLVLVAMGYFTQAGIGDVSALGWDAWSVICPLGYLESLLAGKIFIPRALVSFIAIVAIIIVLGRVFCSWMCPMPFLQRAIPGPKRKPSAKKKLSACADCDTAKKESSSCAECEAAKQLHGKVANFKFDSRHGVLLGALASAAIFGFPVFCLICPVGLTFAAVLLIMRLFAFGETTWGILAVLGVLLAEVLFARKWCSHICPLGALLSLVSGANRMFRPTIDDDKCIHITEGVDCFACSKACPEHIDIRRPLLSEAPMSNCSKCRECAGACPGSAISFPLVPANHKRDAGCERDAVAQEMQQPSAKASIEAARENERVGAGVRANISADAETDASADVDAGASADTRADEKR